MSPEAKPVQVEIFGQTYTLRAEGSPTYVQSLALYVDEKMREVARETRAVDSLRVAILAALNIADEHHRALAKGAPGPGLAADDAAPTAGGKRGAEAAARAKVAARAEADLDRRAGEWIKILDQALTG